MERQAARDREGQRDGETVHQRDGEGQRDGESEWRTDSKKAREGGRKGYKERWREEEREESHRERASQGERERGIKGEREEPKDDVTAQLLPRHKMALPSIMKMEREGGSEGGRVGERAR